MSLRAHAASGVKVASEKTKDDAVKPEDYAKNPNYAEIPNDDAENPENASFGSLLSDDDDEEEDGRRHEGGTTTSSLSSAVIVDASENPRSEGDDDDPTLSSVGKGHRGQPCGSGSGRRPPNKTRRTQSERDRRGELIRLFTHLRRTMYGGRPPWERNPRFG